jgi:pyruvate formate lyase activating enzyme
MKPKPPTLFAIKRYALHDGPQIRTTVFLKGCPLSCRWCHNPEGISPRIELVMNREKCIGCGECVSTCPQQALTPSGTGGIDRNPALCIGCGRCVEVCPALAHEATGWRSSVAAVMAEIEKDLPFYDTSGGGVTFSGGEPLLQADFLLALLAECGRRQIHRTVDTTGHAPVETLLAVAAETDLFLYDLKHMNSEQHRRHTGVDNALILANLAALCHAGHPVRIRLPLVAGVNDDEANIRATLAFLAGLPGIEGIDLLPYHGIARAKYRKLGIDYPGEELSAPGATRITTLAGIINAAGFSTSIGG